MNSQPSQDFINLKKGWFASAICEGSKRQRPSLVIVDETELQGGDPAIDFVEGILGGSGPAPTYVMTLAAGGTALHLIFDALDPRAHAHLKQMRKEGRGNLFLKVGQHVGTFPLKGVPLSSQLWERQLSKLHRRASEWVEQVVPLLPALPIAMAGGMPRLRTISDHRIYMMLPMTPDDARKLGLPVRLG